LLQGEWQGLGVSSESCTPGNSTNTQKGTRYTKLVKGVQRYATKLVWIYGNLHYEDRIKRLGLMRLGRSRIRSDLIEAFKIINGYYDITLDPFFKK